MPIGDLVVMPLPTLYDPSGLTPSTVDPATVAQSQVAAGTSSIAGAIVLQSDPSGNVLMTVFSNQGKHPTWNLGWNDGSNAGNARIHNRATQHAASLGMKMGPWARGNGQIAAPLYPNGKSPYGPGGGFVHPEGGGYPVAGDGSSPSGENNGPYPSGPRRWGRGPRARMGPSTIAGNGSPYGPGGTYAQPSEGGGYRTQGGSYNGPAIAGDPGYQGGGSASSTAGPGQGGSAAATPSVYGPGGSYGGPGGYYGANSVWGTSGSPFAYTPVIPDSQLPVALQRNQRLGNLYPAIPNRYDYALASEAALWLYIAGHGGLKSCCRVPELGAPVWDSPNWKTMQSQDEAFAVMEGADISAFMTELVDGVPTNIGSFTGIDTVIGSFRVPLGYDGVLNRLVFQYTGGSGFADFSGNILWRVKINARYARNLGNVKNAYGSFGDAFNVPGGDIIRLVSGQTVQLIANVPATSPISGGTISAGAYGWFTPRR